MNYLYLLVDKFLMNSFNQEIFKYLKIVQPVIIFDIGSYKGNFSRNLNKKLNLPKKNFYLFDSNPNLKIDDFNYFNETFSNKIKISNFHFNNFFPSSGSSLKNIIKRDKIWNFSRKLITFNFNSNFTTFKVKTNTLDNFCKKKKINKIDLLKIDVEGSELDILIGGKNILKNTNIIHLEVLETKKHFHKKKNKIIDLLNKYNFKLKKDKSILSVSFLSSTSSSDMLFVKE